MRFQRFATPLNHSIDFYNRTAPPLRRRGGPFSLIISPRGEIQKFFLFLFFSEVDLPRRENPEIMLPGRKGDGGGRAVWGKPRSLRYFDIFLRSATGVLIVKAAGGFEPDYCALTILWRSFPMDVRTVHCRQLVVQLFLGRYILKILLRIFILSRAATRPSCSPVWRSWRQ